MGGNALPYTANTAISGKCDKGNGYMTRDPLTCTSDLGQPDEWIFSYNENDNPVTRQSQIHLMDRRLFQIRQLEEIDLRGGHHAVV